MNIRLYLPLLLAATSSLSRACEIPDLTFSALSSQVGHHLIRRSANNKPNFSSLRHQHQARKMSTKFNYPPLERDESLVDKQFGLDVPDPYRKLEDPDAPITKTFVDSQNELTKSYLNKCPHKDRLKQILTDSQNFERNSCPFKRGNYYYFFKNSGLQPQSVLYQQTSPDSEPKEFLDPNKFSDDGTVALGVCAFSVNGDYFAYGLSYSGSDWLEIRVRDVKTGKDLDDVISKVKFSNIAWTHDHQGFFYGRPQFDGNAVGTAVDLNLNFTVYYHKLGTPQSSDVLKLDFPEHPTWNIQLEISDDGKQFYAYAKEGCDDVLWYYGYLDQFGPSDKLTLKPLYEKNGSRFQYVTNDGDTVYFKTNLNAPNFRLVKLDLKNPAEENWKDVIPNNPEGVLDNVEAFTVNGEDYFLVDYVKNVVDYLELRRFDGSLVRKFETSTGTISKSGSRRTDTEIFFQLSSFLTPGRTFRFDLTNLSSEPKLIRESRPKNFNPDEYKIDQVFYKSTGGVEVPMFLVHRKDMKLDGSNPCLLYGYGGFGLSLQPSFGVSRIAWMQNFNGIYAVANIRGGMERGKEWHDSGRQLKKQNVFDDFAAAGEYLIANNYTNKDKLAIEGGSNGGLLVAASSNQRPDLFGACICHVGVLDMTRFHLFTIGHAWRSDYGDPAEEEHFKNLLKYSPYHNIPENVTRYPATLLLTADHDDRVVPGHSLKFIAQLQHKLGKKLEDTPLLIRVDTKAGHGAGRPVAKIIDEYADIYSFLYNALDLEKNFRAD